MAQNSAAEVLLEPACQNCGCLLSFYPGLPKDAVRCVECLVFLQKLEKLNETELERFFLVQDWDSKDLGLFSFEYKKRNLEIPRRA